MWGWLLGLDTVWIVLILSAIAGTLLALAVYLLERGFRTEWEAPAEPESWAHRISQEHPVVRSLDPNWREAMAEIESWEPRPRARHRWSDLGQDTELLRLETPER